MTRNVQVLITDDITGEPNARTFTFAVESTTYEIDLTEENIAALREALAPWITAARATRSAQIPTQRSRSDGRDPAAAAIRQWARENGIQVPDRGRLPVDVREKYEAEH